jgi:hypothetical protein
MMKIKLLSISLIIALAVISCKPEMAKDEIYRIGTEQCARQPLFAIKMGYEPSRSAFSTTQNNVKGLSLIEIPINPADSLKYKIYQHPSWEKQGFMGSITTSNDGSIFTAPIPKINTLERTLSKMNMVYKVNYKTGIMTELCTLPKADTTQGVVPYGVLGVYYDCHAHKLYVSSVAGSTRDDQKGVIYLIDPFSGKIEDKYEGIDAMGLFVAGITGDKKLYFGSARNSEIYSIELNKKGEFIGKHITEFTLDQLGPRGDDKARRIRLNKNGNLSIFGVEFNFSLAAPTVIPQSVYEYGYNDELKKWVNVAVN